MGKISPFAIFTAIVKKVSRSLLLLPFSPSRKMKLSPVGCNFFGLQCRGLKLEIGGVKRERVGTSYILFKDAKLFPFRALRSMSLKVIVSLILL